MKQHAFALRLRRLTDSFWGAVLGAGVYAAWATWANWDAGPRLAFTIGATHWLASTFLTYTGTAVMRRCFAQGSGRLEAALLTFVCGLAYTYLILLGAHGLIGTPHLLLTLAAGVIPNVLFCGSYVLLLVRTDTAKPPVPAAALLSQQSV